MDIRDFITKPRWCILPWTHAFIDPLGKVKPCCRFRGREVPGDCNLEENSLDDLFSGPVFETLRQSMVVDDSPTGCQRCWEEESAGKGMSLRQNHNRRWDELVSADWVGRPEISFLEIGLSSLCNLKCRMCDSRYSSKWVSDEVKLLGETINPNPPRKFSVSSVDGCLSRLRHIKFTGGEPLLIPEHQLILEKIFEMERASQVAINYSTNVTTLPKQDLQSLWRNFSRVEVALSVDGIGEVNDYVRNPSKWEQVEAVAVGFFEIAENMPNLFLGLRPSVSVYNLLSQPDLLRWWLKLCDKYPRAGERARKWVSLTHVTYPEQLSLQVLPQKTKERWTQMIDASLDGLPEKWSESCRSLCRYMLAHDREDLFSQLVSFTHDLDEIRQESVDTACPQLGAAIREWNGLGK
ncbi:MAG: twitch domain-containing radical SAM protein [Bdellovibrionaceae bacterium]|nr:twitch domain-containing radical SAM protein [Bdellovibrionales bacterium]MCB9085095.1 twitch domain-containing radical SAM protein [Pseudobdellovibrionaceae bacterium]